MTFDVPSTVVVTGHFPPRRGGVQTFAAELLHRLPPQRLVVIAPACPGAAASDAALDFPVVRRGGYLLTRDLARVVRHHRAEVAWIPSVAPIGLLAPGIRAAGVRRVVGSTHGQELGWLRSAPTRGAVRAMAGSLDVLTYLGPRGRCALGGVVEHPDRLYRLAGGVDTEVFHAGCDGAPSRLRYGLGERPLAISVSRLVRRKGQDVLIAAWPRVLAAVPDARLLIVGVGPYRRPLERLARARGVTGSVVFTGGLPTPELVGCLAAADVFVAPCRDDRRGLQTEGLGLATLEASAMGLPVVVGDSGGSADSLLDAETGLLVDARHPAPVAAALIWLLADRERARAIGARGLRWVREHWTWEAGAAGLAGLLSGALP